MNAGSHSHAPVALLDEELELYRAWIRETIGITMSAAKRPLIAGRLGKRLRVLGLTSYAAYLDLVRSGRDPVESQLAMDLLTTNETRFFREPRHFDVLAELLRGLPASTEPVRLWSAACSTGEEPYTMAMVAARHCARPWQVLASDVSARALDTAMKGIYPMARAESIPGDMLREYCLKGVGEQRGSFAVDPAITRGVRFMRHNLVTGDAQLGEFHAIFLRNVMIYFDPPAKVRAVQAVTRHLRPGGLLFIGHAESLGEWREGLATAGSATYRKVA
jgi:chemotaxis protein methyltransferase CheR